MGLGKKGFGGRYLYVLVVGGAKLAAANLRSPGLSRRPRSGENGAPIIGIAGTSPAMTKQELPQVLLLLLLVMSCALIGCSGVEKFGTVDPRYGATSNA